MIKAYKNFWKQALQSEGTSRRSDYWWVFLIHSIFRTVIIVSEFILIIVEFLKRMTPTSSGAQVQQITQDLINNTPSSIWQIQILGALFSLLIMLPVTTLTTRRLRDAGYSPGLAYPLPAIYIANVLTLLLSSPILSLIVLLAASYALTLLILCAQPTKKQP